MEPVRFLCVLVHFLLWLTQAPACILCCQCGSFLPNDPFYYTNETSNLICALEKPSSLINASHLYVTFNGVEVNSSFMTVINETAVSFNKVMRREDDGQYKCRLRGFTGMPGDVGTQYLKVDDPIKPVNDIECIWHNWRDKLVCSWALPYRYMQYIKVDLQWGRVTFRNGSPLLRVGYNCPVLSKTTCTWDATDMTIDNSHICLNLSVANVAGPPATPFIKLIYTTDIVKPHAVDYFHQEFTNLSSCLLVNWIYDTNIANSRTKFFRIQYSPVTDPSDNTTEWSDEYNMTICNLTAYTSYNFTIAVHPDRAELKGYWSDSVTQQILTDQDVPGVAPELVGYRQLSELCIQKEKTISTIFWKSIPEVERNGLITNYSVTFTDLSPGGIVTEVIITNAQDTSVNHYLHCNKLYNVSISAATVKGYSPHHSSLIINTADMTPPAVMVERNDSLYDVSWTVPRPVDSLTSFSVVYCTTIGSQQDCSGELQKVYVPDFRTRHQTLSLKSDTTYLFGVSVIRTGVTSAAKFESCIYVVTETPNIPVFSVDATIGENRLRVEWDPITCNNKQPYVKNFTITWCQTNNKLEDQCIGKKESVVIPSTSKRDHIITNLEKDVRYGVTMLSSSSSQTSLRSEMQYGTPTNSDFSVAEISGIAIGCVFLGVLAIAGLVLACRVTKHGITKIRKPYVIDIPHLDKDSSPSSSTSSSRFMNNSQQALLPAQRSMEIDCHNNPGQNKSGKSNGVQTKRQNSRDSGKGGSLSTESDSPDRLDPVPEDEISPYTKVPGGDDYTSKIPATSGIGSSTPSSVNNPYSMVHTSHPNCQSSGEEGESQSEGRPDSSGEVHIHPAEMTVMFVGATNPSEESPGTNDGYTGHNQLMYVHHSSMVQPGRTVEATTGPPVTNDTGHMIAPYDNAIHASRHSSYTLHSK